MFLTVDLIFSTGCFSDPLMEAEYVNVTEVRLSKFGTLFDTLVFVKPGDINANQTPLLLLQANPVYEELGEDRCTDVQFTI